MKNQSVVAWLRGKKFIVRGAYVIWKGFMHTLSWLGKCLAWHVGNGQDILVGIGLIIGTQSLSWLPSSLREYLEDLGISTLSHAHNILLGQHHYWYTAEDLCISGEWKLAWENFTRSLELRRIKLSSLSDSLVWDYNKSEGSVSAELVYDFIVHSSSPPTGSKLLAFLWSGILPKKICCFVWMAMANKILTWDNLQKRG